ncbi:hypothetical protein ACIPJN_23840 [Streptomyces sp. NPDC086796]|uniref:hypothetical protein n=1 Tax=unclassified Streptomyces TaxID=2593676 RepID=UPI002E78FC00|nr:hypothetical protein [Streptomyces sp. JV190]MEE1839720.1 hypothetical protein [Streptomyces sp. JV190]
MPRRPAHVRRAGRAWCGQERRSRWYREEERRTARIASHTIAVLVGTSPAPAIKIGG